MSSVETMPLAANSNINSNEDRTDILGVRVRRTNLTQTLDDVEASMRRGDRRYAVFINVYNVIESRGDANYRKTLNEADFPMPDGIPLVWASKVLGRPVGSRVCGPDFLVEMNK